MTERYFKIALLPGVVAGRCAELLSRKPVAFAGGVARLSLAPGDVALLEMAK